MSQQEANNWYTLISIFDEEDLVRLHKRVDLLKPGTAEARNLQLALSGELINREIAAEEAEPVP